MVFIADFKDLFGEVKYELGFAISGEEFACVVPYVRDVRRRFESYEAEKVLNLAKRLTKYGIKPTINREIKYKHNGRQIGFTELEKINVKRLEEIIKRKEMPKKSFPLTALDRV